jgi:hypothetical protein
VLSPCLYRKACIDRRGFFFLEPAINSGYFPFKKLWGSKVQRFKIGVVSTFDVGHSMFDVPFLNTKEVFHVANWVCRMAGNGWVGPHGPDERGAGL